MDAKEAGGAEFSPERIGRRTRSDHVLEIFTAIFSYQLANAVAQRPVVVGGIDKRGKE
jgi:hypothetical protein